MQRRKTKLSADLLTKTESLHTSSAAIIYPTYIPIPCFISIFSQQSFPRTLLPCPLLPSATFDPSFQSISHSLSRSISFLWPSRGATRCMQLDVLTIRVEDTWSFTGGGSSPYLTFPFFPARVFNTSCACSPRQRTYLISFWLSLHLYVLHLSVVLFAFFLCLETLSSFWRSALSSALLMCLSFAFLFPTSSDCMCS